MIQFDDFWPDDEELDGQPTADLPWPADGRHAGEIVRVRDENFPFMERHGAEGRSLAIDVRIPKARQLESIISVTWRGKIAEVCRAARIRPPAKGENWDEKQLVGRQVVVETVMKLAPATGREYCRIEKWYPQAEPPAKVETAAAAPAAAATNRRRPEPAGVEDDIPF
jgi:hypothetical protein